MLQFMIYCEIVREVAFAHMKGNYGGKTLKLVDI